MKVLVADKFESEGIEQLKILGCEVILKPDLKDDAFPAVVAESGCRILIVRGRKVPESVINAGRQLGLIVRAGAGVNTIDVAAASRQSVFVANCPGKNASAVAELTFGLIISLDRRIPDNVVDLRQGRWAKKEYSKARGLKGKTLGIIGMGRIGELVTGLAQAFGMKVVAWSRSLTPEKASELGVIHMDLPEEVAASCDILTVHLAASPETEKLVGRNVFEEMKPGAYFINTARAEVMDFEALAAAVKEKGLRVGLDVFAKEPGAQDHDFTDSIVNLPGVIYGTHHIGASTEEAQLAIADETARIVQEYMNTGHVLNCVNISCGQMAQGTLVVRHRNKPGVLAHVLGELAKAGINVREMENVIHQGEIGACAQIRLDSKPGEETLRRIESSNENILSVSLTTPRTNSNRK